MHAMITIIVLCCAALVASEAPAAPSNSDIHNKDGGGFSVQTGYEGYLVPTDHIDASESTGLGSGIASLASSFLTGGDPVGTLASLLSGIESGPESIESHGVSEEKGHNIKVTGIHGKPVVIPLPLKHKLSKLQKLGPKKLALIKIVTKLIVTTVVVAIILLLTGGIAASVCAFTPLCSISFLSQAEHVRSLMPANAFNQVTSFALDAIEKYQEYQKNYKQ